MTEQQSERLPYATLRAKGEDRRQRIVAVAQRLASEQGWRRTSIGQIAREAGVTPAGLLHHFESKEQLLNAVLDARDADDMAHLDLSADFEVQIAQVADRFTRSPQLVGTFAVLLMENLDPAAPLHGRFLDRYRAGREIVAAAIRRGQESGRFRSDVDADVKAVEIIAVITGMETSWMLDPSIPLAEVFAQYAASLVAQLAIPTEMS
jgi:AcrR family transcriptional regulator